VEVLDFGHLTDAQRTQLEGDEHDPFDAAGVTLEFRAKERHVALSEGGRLVASAGLTRAEVAVSGMRLEVVGIGGVIVAAAWRGQGLAREVLEHALERARAMGPQFALLFCHDGRAGLYERLGFAVIEAPVTVGQRAGFEPMLQQLSMWGPLAADAAWPVGPVTVYGLPF
jgi:predicted N-acetyltransferase YhbS